MGQNCVELMSVNLPSPLPWLNCPRINISLCLLSEGDLETNFRLKLGFWLDPFEYGGSDIPEMIYRNQKERDIFLVAKRTD